MRSGQRWVNSMAITIPIANAEMNNYKADAAVWPIYKRTNICGPFASCQLPVGEVASWGSCHLVVLSSVNLLFLPAWALLGGAGRRRRQRQSQYFGWSGSVVALLSARRRRQQQQQQQHVVMENKHAPWQRTLHGGSNSRALRSQNKNKSKKQKHKQAIRQTTKQTICIEDAPCRARPNPQPLQIATTTRVTTTTTTTMAKTKGASGQTGTAQPRPQQQLLFFFAAKKNRQCEYATRNGTKRKTTTRKREIRETREKKENWKVLIRKLFAVISFLCLETVLINAANALRSANSRVRSSCSSCSRRRHHCRPNPLRLPAFLCN